MRWRKHGVHVVCERSTATYEPGQCHGNPAGLGLDRTHTSSVGGLAGGAVLLGGLWAGERVQLLQQKPLKRQSKVATWAVMRHWSGSTVQAWMLTSPA